MCVIVHCLLGGALMNFNNVITKEFFHNNFQYYDNPLHEEVNYWTKSLGDDSKIKL
jgi:hypothetical protein